MRKATKPRAMSPLMERVPATTADVVSSHPGR